MSIKKVFIVLVSEVSNRWNVSSLAFNDVNNAIEWIEKRSDRPQRVDAGWYWIGKNYDYKIVDVDVR